MCSKCTALPIRKMFPPQARKLARIVLPKWVRKSRSEAPLPKPLICTKGEAKNGYGNVTQNEYGNVVQNPPPETPNLAKT